MRPRSAGRNRLYHSYAPAIATIVYTTAPPALRHGRGGGVGHCASIVLIQLLSLILPYFPSRAVRMRLASDSTDFFTLASLGLRPVDKYFIKKALARCS